MQLANEKINAISNDELNAELIFSSTDENSCKTTSTTTSSSDDLKSMQTKLSLQARQIAKMRLTLHRQRMQISRLKSLNGRLQHKFYCAKVGKIEMTPAQEKKLTGVKRVNWGVEDIVRALTVRSVNPKAYETATITWRLPLPSVRTLQRWIGKFRCDEGLLIDIRQQFETRHSTKFALIRKCK
ncbi:unnamed protein product [Allacma fusca]|uniref:Uncharacterized protein n=1 Tax=Allacma fusca TaxID=39272 RepID=A0A8J2K920_9HEXA|nr:unnamed protein product [Allacma fusca]